MKGKAEVQTYFHNYSGESDWLLVPGFVERRPRSWCASGPAVRRAALLVLLRWEESALAYVRDFRYARYATEGSESQQRHLLFSVCAASASRTAACACTTLAGHRVASPACASWLVPIVAGGASLGESQNGFLIPKRQS